MVAPGGNHILLDFWGVTPDKLSSCEFVENNLRTVAEKCNATVLNSYMHSFGENCGVTGVVILAESHISLHGWSEEGYCALDVFMCGKADAEKSINLLIEIFKPNYSNIKYIERGNRK